MPWTGTRFEEVTSFERLDALAGPWRDLWARAPGATPFSAPEWLRPWCRHLASAPPRALLAWRGRDLVGLAPTFVYRARGERVLGLLGGGVSDYQDALAEDAPTAAELLAALVEPRAAYDRVLLEALPHGSPLLAAAPAVGGAGVAPHDVCPVLALPASLEGLAGRAEPSLLADVRRQRRRLARRGRLEVTRDAPGDWRAVLDDLLALHAARWRSRGQPGVVAAGALRAFQAEAAAGLARAGLLCLTAVRLDGRTIAALHAFAARGRVYAYLQGFDPALTRYSPGSVLLAAAIEQAIAEGARELDMLRGTEPYKYRWGAEDRRTFRLSVGAQPGARATAATV